MKRLWRKSVKPGEGSSTSLRTSKESTLGTSLSNHIPFFRSNKTAPAASTISSPSVLHPNIRECGEISGTTALHHSSDEAEQPNMPLPVPIPSLLRSSQSEADSTVERPPTDKMTAIKSYFWEMHVRWTAIVSHPTAVLLLESIFLQPAYLCFFAVLTTYILGSLRFSYFWCLLIAVAVNFAASKITSRIISSTIRKERLHGTSHRTEMYPDKESAVWVNNMIIGVISNHHTYISKILLRFLNPMLHRFLAIPPVEYIKFEDLDIGTNPPRISNCAVTLDEHSPPHSLKYDFDVELATNMNGSMKLRLAILPEIPLIVSNLVFKSRMRIAVSFVSQKFPFISTCRISVLEEPEIDISVEMAGLPDFLILPFVTDHYLKVIRRFLYQQIGAPNYVEIDLSVLLQDEGDAGECLVEDVQAIIPGIIRHGNIPVDTPVATPEASKKPKGSKISRAVHKIKRTPFSTPKRYDVASLMKGEPKTMSVSSDVVLSEREIINSSGILGAALGSKHKTPNIAITDSSGATRLTQSTTNTPEPPSNTPMLKRFRRGNGYVMSPNLSDSGRYRRSGLRKATGRHSFNRSSSSFDEQSLKRLISESDSDTPSSADSPRNNSGNLSD